MWTCSLTRAKERQASYIVISMGYVHAFALARLARGKLMAAPGEEKEVVFGDPRTTQRYYDHLEVDDLEVALQLVPDLTPARQSAALER